MNLQIIESNFAVEQDGYEDKVIQVERGGFLARLFDPDPTLPLWQKTKTKTVKVPHYKPVIYRLLDKLIVHPSLVETLRNVATQNRSDVFRW